MVNGAASHTAHTPQCAPARATYPLAHALHASAHGMAVACASEISWAARRRGSAIACDCAWTRTMC